MKNKCYLLIPLIATLLSSCGGDKGAKVDLYKNLNKVSIGALSFDFGLPATMASGNSVEMLAVFSLQNTSSKSFEISFTKMPYFYRESDNSVFEATGNFSEVPALYTVESGESKSFSFKTKFIQTGAIVMPFPTTDFCFTLEYNDNVLINYHLYDKVD